MNALALQFDGVHNTQEYRQMTDNQELSEWLTTTEAAVIMGVADTNVAYLCRKGKIRCQKWGKAWMVSKEDAEAYQRSKRNPTWLRDENETKD